MSLTAADRAFLRSVSRAGRVGLTPDEVARKLGVSEAAVRSRASRLADLGLIERSRAHGFAFYALTPDGVKEHRR